MALIERLREAALVVAHPDDEILWFSSILLLVRRVFICYLDVPGQEEWTRGRRLASAQFPLPNAEFVGLTESVAFKMADWSFPRVAPNGLALNAPRDRQPLPGFSARRYEDNFHALQTHLKEALKGYPLVFTHNPWGEYGHEEHVQVHQVVVGLREAMGFELWFDNYASDRSATLMARALAHRHLEYETLPTQPESVAGIEALYRRHGCWTWPFDDYLWFASESFARCLPRTRHGKSAGGTFPVNYINVDNADLQMLKPSRWSTLRPLVRQVRRRLFGGNAP